MVKPIQLTIIILSCSSLVSCAYVGDSCVSDGKPGTCRFITQCPQAIANLQNGIYPQICGFDGTQSIVCCPGDVQKPPTPERPKRKPGEISAKKCREYSKYIWEVEANPTFLVGAEDISRRQCPFDKLPLIVGGTPASRQEFPHMVQIGYKPDLEVKWLCGGSLISEKFVLTAGHCLNDRKWGDAEYVRMGVIKQTGTDHLQVYKVIEIIEYPDYSPPSHYHDIGLLKLEKDVDMNPYARPACLYAKDELPKSNVIASGWGRVGYTDPDSNDLLKVVLECYTQPKCNQTYSRLAGKNKLMDGIRDDWMICAGSSTELKDTCQGDSGGPLQIYKEGVEGLDCMYDIIGVTSFGQACGLAIDVPGVYTRVSHYLQWIEDKVWPAA